MDIDEVRAKGITKIRLPHWANPADHVQLVSDLPWCYLWSTTNELIGQRNPIDIPVYALRGIDTWEEYIPTQPATAPTPAPRPK